MNKKSIFLFSLIAVLFFGCQKEPIVEFTASKTNAEVSEAITFTNNSVDGDTYEWEFGDGTTSTEISPNHAFTQAGNFIVKLTAFSKNGKKSDETSLTITIVELNAKFIGSYSCNETEASDYCGDGSDTYTFSIVAGSTGDEIKFNNLARGLSGVTATITGNTISIPRQNNFYNTATLSTWDINYTGETTGTLNGTTLTFTYMVDDIMYGSNCGKVLCTVTATKL